MTLSVLKSSNQQLWFTICLRLGKILLEQQNIPELESILTDLKSSCRKTNTDADGDQIMSGLTKSKSTIYEEYDQSKSNLLLETFALEIQMCDQMGDKKRLKRIYP